ncbi:MAG TPA: 5'-3' exonuclease H3TH domain-containing protein [Myxococcota bacterium]|nr:5'-3' exonuclease H3TH domain-containing protein [Myxococcota bacterium]
MQLHLIDGTYELFRAFYGAPGSISPQGVEVGATRGILRSLHGLLREPGVSHLGIAFDTVIESFRNRLFAGYKTGDGIEPTLLAQFSLAERAAAALGLVVWPMIEHETDDALATAALRWRQAPGVTQVRICSPDKDFAQCVQGDRVVLWDRLRQIVLDEAGVVEKFGVSPASMPDWLALVGDTADGIPGVPRWGKKSASALLAYYHHLEAIPDDEAQWHVKPRGASGLAQSLRAMRTEVLLYRDLATLRTDVPLREDLTDLQWRGARRDLLPSLCEELGDEGFVARIEHWQ